MPRQVLRTSSLDATLVFSSNLTGKKSLFGPSFEKTKLNHTANGRVFKQRSQFNYCIFHLSSWENLLFGTKPTIISNQNHVLFERIKSIPFVISYSVRALSDVFYLKHQQTKSLSGLEHEEDEIICKNICKYSLVNYDLIQILIGLIQNAII